ncbi:hypothetical protein OA88_17745 [Flavobacterium sp. JRM]|nr:hypothetical protein OA88_17745 [Flavobacterium sp. JRM]
MKRLTENSTFQEILNIVKPIIEEYIQSNNSNLIFYKHPLGFYYARLYESDKVQIRLHIWQKNFTLKEDLYIHDHYYDLNSWILSGKIVDYIYEISDSKSKGEYVKYVGSYNKNENNRVLKKTNEYYNILNISERYLNRGDKYSIKKNQFHSNKITFEDYTITSTLVYTHNPNLLHSPTVLGKTQMEQIIEDKPLVISYLETQKILTELLKEL